MGYPSLANKQGVSMPLHIALPAEYDFTHLQSFYGRDPEPTGEIVQAGCIRKNILHQGKPIQLTLSKQPESLQVKQEGVAPMNHEELLALVQHLAGLQQNTHHFRHEYYQHPELGSLIQQAPSLFVPQLMPFEALSWAIIGQLISVAAATTIR